jgi:hypothetical protein
LAEVLGGSGGGGGAHDVVSASNNKLASEDVNLGLRAYEAKEKIYSLAFNLSTYKNFNLVYLLVPKIFKVLSKKDLFLSLKICLCLKYALKKPQILT